MSESRLKHMENPANHVRGMAESDGSSHIVLESQAEERDSWRRPENVTARLKLYSHIRRTRFALTLYDEGFLMVRETHGRKQAAERLLDLRFVDPQPKISQVSAPRLAYVSLSLAALTGGVGILAWYGFMTMVAFSATLSLGSATGIAMWLFLCRTGEQSVFCTATGRADVLRLFGTLGSLSALRSIVPALAEAARRARDSGADDKQLYLRQEMREHYRLSECGIISTEDCAACTQRILKQFG